jgi:hypothetical protein
MSRLSMTSEGARPLRFVASFDQSPLMIAGAIIVLYVLGAQARTETPDEVDKILALLKAENCEILRDAMGAKKLSVEGSSFMVEAKCSDGKSYRFTLDQNFKILSKKAGNF